jgi:hypothetical protein
MWGNRWQNRAVKLALDNFYYLNNIFSRLNPPDIVTLKAIAHIIFTTALEEDNQFKAAQMCRILTRWRYIENTNIIEELLSIIQQYYEDKIEKYDNEYSGHNLVELEKFAIFISWLYNLKVMRTNFFADMLYNFIMRKPCINIKVYIGAIIVKKVGHVLILDRINIFSKTFTRIDELAKQPTLRLTLDTKKTIIATLNMYPVFSANAYKKYYKLIDENNKAVNNLSKIEELKEEIAKEKNQKTELLNKLGRSNN